MLTLKQSLKEARENKVAIGHFGVGTMAMMRGLIDAAMELSDEINHPFTGGKIPVIVGVSEGDRKVFGTIEAVQLTKLYQEIYDYPIFIDADHTHDIDAVKEAIDLGYDMVIYDAVTAAYEDNVAGTKEVVAYKNEVNPECIVEAELGYIASGSDMKDELPDGVGPETMTRPDEAKAFVEATGIDALAPAVGNVHGMIKSGNPRLDIDLIGELSASTDAHLVLHGGSGIADEDFVKGIQAGFTVIHVATEIRKAHREALEKAFAENPSVSPTKSVPQAYEAVKAVMKKRMKLFTIGE